MGHLDEFPYELWAHRGRMCEKAEIPFLKMIDRTAGKGQAGAAKLPKCWGGIPT